MPKEAGECVDCGVAAETTIEGYRCPECLVEAFGEEGPVEDDPVEDGRYKGFVDRYTAYYGVEWEQIRQTVLARDGWECVDCGLSDEAHRARADLFPVDGGLHVHHIEKAWRFDTYAGANSLDNLVSVCAPCHRVRESG